VIVSVVYFMSTSGMFSGVTNAGTTTTAFTPARIQVVDYNLQHTEGQFFTIHYDLTGQVMNRGGMNSGPIVLGLTLTENGASVYQTTFSPTPSQLSPGQSAYFSQPISISASVNFDHYKVEVISQ
jgi:hypothetical protein